MPTLSHSNVTSDRPPFAPQQRLAQPRKLILLNRDGEERSRKQRTPLKDAPTASVPEGMTPTQLGFGLRRRRRVVQDFRFDDFKPTSEFQEEKFSPSRLGSIKNSPESEIPKHWAIVSEGFPPGVTVDELKKYGRRRQLTHLRPQDNLRLEEGSLGAYKSEYKRRFLAYSLPKVVLSSAEKNGFGDGDCYLRGPLLRPRNNLFVAKDQPMEGMTEKKSKYIPFPHHEKRKLLRRSTALRPEGEIGRETEVRKEYVAHKNPEKVRLIRNLPSLRVEGEWEPLTTEQREKFIAYLLGGRPVLKKNKSSLKMEGNFDFATEKNRSYVPHEFSGRPSLRKRSTSLKLEGEVEFCPEYRISFVDFPRSRPVTYKPLGKLRHEGDFEDLTEMKTQFVNYENVQIPESAKPENNLHVEGDMEINPEYRINFVDFPRERPIPRKPFNQLKPEGNLKVLTENSERHSGVEEVHSDSLSKLVDLSSDKEVSFLPGKTREEKGDEIASKVETPKGNPKPEGEMTSAGEGDDGPGMQKEEENSVIPARFEREFLFCPEFNKYYIGGDRERSGKLAKEVKSNSSSPRKKGQRDKLKSCLDDEKKSAPLIPHGKSSVKRMREAVSENTQSEILREKSDKLEGGRKRDVRQLSQNLRFVEMFPKEDPPPLKEFPAFKVLDVKGQIGCQTIANDILESEKSTSDEENSTYRLEVYNPDNGSSGFHGSSRRIFPSSALYHKQRAGNYVKIVRSPEIPKSLLQGDREAERSWRISEKPCPFASRENLSERSFLVLEKKGAPGTVPPATPRNAATKDEVWTPPCDSPLP